MLDVVTPDAASIGIIPFILDPAKFATMQSEKEKYMVLSYEIINK